MARQRDALQLAPAARIEQAEFDSLGVGRKEREVDAFAIPGRAEGKGLALFGRDVARADHAGGSGSNCSHSTLSGGT